MVKEANTLREFPLHQDWNILDEKKYTSYQIWTPLELTSAYNGGMYVLPGSHRFFGNYRSGSYGIPIADTDSSLISSVVDMLVAPGQALVYHNSLFHASYPNLSERNRISTIVSIYQKAAPLRYYHKNTGCKRTDIYEIDSDFFLTNLNKLERGEFPEPERYKEALPISPICNKEIKSTDLVLSYKSAFEDEGEGYEARQLFILRDKELERKMQRNGYIIVDFADGKTVDELKSIYLNTFEERQTSSGRFTTMENTTPTARRFFHELILEKINVSLEKYFENYQVPIASYFVKYGKSKGDLNWHNDSSLLLNAHLEPHYAIWCPLIDVNAGNGSLCVIERSHRFNNVPIIHDLPWPFSGLEPLFEDKKKILELQAGQAVIFDIRTIHHATSNDTEKDRVCFSLRLTHQKSKYYNFLCERDDKGKVSVFEETPDCYLRDEWNTGKRPNLTSKIGELNKLYDRINLKEIESALETGSV